MMLGSEDAWAARPIESVGTPNEALMREHGVTKRLLLIYREIIYRIDSDRGDFPPDAVLSASKLVRSFVEDYHESLEENYVFPRVSKAGQLKNLTQVLFEQHRRGRVLVDGIMHLAPASISEKSADQAKLRHMLYEFVRMYDPHEAREDTVLFPEFRSVLSKGEYDDLVGEFAKKDQDMFNGDGFTGAVHAVAEIEKQLGIYELSKFNLTGQPSPK